MIPGSTVEQAATKPRELPVAAKSSIEPKNMQQQKKPSKRHSASDETVLSPECDRTSFQPNPKAGPQPKATINIASTEATATALHDSEHGTGRDEPRTVSPNYLDSRFFARGGSGSGHVSTEACFSECSFREHNTYSLQGCEAPASGGKASTDESPAASGTTDRAESEEATCLEIGGDNLSFPELLAATRDADPIVAAAAAAAAVAAASAATSLELAPHFEKQGFAPHRWPTPAAAAAASAVVASSFTGLESDSNASSLTLCASTSAWDPLQQQLSQESTSTDAATAKVEVAAAEAAAAASVSGTSFAPARAGEASSSPETMPASAAFSSPWPTSYPGVGNVPTQGTPPTSAGTETSSAAQALPSSLTCLPFRPESLEADSSSRPTPSAPWLVQEALSVKAAVDAAVRGASCCSSGDVEAVGKGACGGDEARTWSARSQEEAYGSATSMAFADDAIAEVPRVMADLRAALGRGVMSSSEAKAWVQALDRLGEGLDRDKLREDCPDVTRGALPSGSSSLPTSAAAGPSALTVPREQPPRVISSDPELDPVTATTGIRRQSRDFSSPQALSSPLALGNIVDQCPLPSPLGGVESIVGGAAGEKGEGAAPQADPGMEKCNSDDVNNYDDVTDDDVTNNDANNDSKNRDDSHNFCSKSSSSKGRTRKGAGDGRGKKQTTRGDDVTSPAAAAALAPPPAAAVSSRTRRSAGARTRGGNDRQTTTKSDEISSLSLSKASVTFTTVTKRSGSTAKENPERAAATTAVQRNDSAGGGGDGGGGAVRRRERRNASKFPDDVIGKIPCLCADLNAALGRNVPLQEVKNCLRLLDGNGEGLHRRDLLGACLELLRRGPKRETHPVPPPDSKPDSTGRAEGPGLAPNAIRHRDPARSSTALKATESPVDYPSEPPTESRTESQAVKETFARPKKRGRSCAGQSDAGSNEGDDASSGNSNNDACSSGSGGSSCKNRGGGGGGAAVGASTPGTKEDVADSPAAPAAAASRKVSRNGVGRHALVPRRSRGLIPESVIAKVPRLLVDMASVLGYCVSANEAKARCRELERCGEGLTAKELCDACVCLLLRRASRNRNRTRGNVNLSSINRNSSINRSSSSSRGSNGSSKYDKGRRRIKQEKKEKDVAEVAEKGQHGGGLGEKSSEERQARSSVSAAVSAEALAASTPSKESSDAKEELMKEAALEEKTEFHEAVALSKGRSGGVLEEKQAGDVRVKKRPRLAVRELPESVVAKFPRLVLDLETFVGYPVSVEEVVERCRQLDRGGEGLTQQELCDACVSLLLRVDDRNLIGSGESAHISPPDSVTEERPFPGGRVVGNVQDKGEFASNTEGSRVRGGCSKKGTTAMLLCRAQNDAGPRGNVALPNLQQRGARDIPPDWSRPLLDYRQASSDSSFPDQDADDYINDSPNSMHMRRPLEIAGVDVSSFSFENESSASETDEGLDGWTEKRELDDDMSVSFSGWNGSGVSSDARSSAQSRAEPKGVNESGKSVVSGAAAPNIATNHNSCLDNNKRVAADEAEKTDDREGSRDIVADEVDSQSQALLQGEVGEFAVFPTPSGSSVPFLVGKILEKRIVSLDGLNTSRHCSGECDLAKRMEILVHWFTPKKKTTTRTRTMTRIGLNGGIRSGSDSGSDSASGVVGSKGEVSSKSAATATAEAVVSSYAIGGWSPVYVPCPRTKRLVRDTGVECLAAAILVFPRLLSSDALPASVREALKPAVVKQAATAASKSEGRDGSSDGNGDGCSSSGSGSKAKGIERKKSILDRCDDSDFEDDAY